MVVRMGCIGAGSWAVAAHLPALKQRPEVEFVAVARHNKQMLDKIAAEFGFAVASEDYRAVIDAAPDIVVVASPSGLHHEHAKAALEAGAHVLCEKPMTISPADAWDLVETAERVGKQLLISFGWNYQPIVREAVALIGRHPIGRLEQVTIHMASPTRELLSNTGSYPDASPDTTPEQATWTDASISGGGYGQAQLSHALGLALGLIAEDVDEVFAMSAAPLGAPVELHDAATMRFAGGGIGVLSGGSNHVGASGNKHELEVRAIGSDGQFHVDLHRDRVWVYRPGEVDIELDLPPGAGNYVPTAPANALVDVALGDESANAAPGRLGARTVDTLDLLYRSLRSGGLARRER